jgi:predicted RNase H-like HicB family nuclease
MSVEYSAHIVWSQEDEAYVASVMELPGCMADGSSPEEALSNLRAVAKEWIEIAKAEGRDVPPPQTLQDLGKEHMVFQKWLNNHMQQEVRAAVQRIINQLASSVPQSGFHQRFSLADFEPTGR